MSLYIAGPMTGRVDFNYPAFFAAERELRAAGYSTINPVRRWDGPPGPAWTDYMRRGIRDVTEADGIALLEDWDLSRGARLECWVARALGVDCLPVAAWCRLARPEQAGADR